MSCTDIYGAISSPRKERAGREPASLLIYGIVVIDKYVQLFHVQGENWVLWHGEGMCELSERGAA